MSDNDKPLAEQLRSAAEDMDGPLLPVSRMYMQLADRVEAYEVGIKQLAAEIGQLRYALSDCLTYCPDYIHGQPKIKYERLARPPEKLK